jgi:hypothetical protein
MGGSWWQLKAVIAVIMLADIPASPVFPFFLTYKCQLKLSNVLFPNVWS